MKNKLPVLAFIVFIGINSSLAQQVYKSGGTSLSTFLFSYPSYAAKSQCIFLPSDLTNTMSGSITTLYYKYGESGTPQTMYNYTIKMGQTTSTSFGVTNDFFTGLTAVLSAASYIIPAGTTGNWFAIQLTTPFNFDATKTLIIQFTFSSASEGSWGTLGTSNTPVKKIISPDTLATTGDPSSSTWQDMGFDLAIVPVIQLSPFQGALQVFPNPCHDNLNLRLSTRHKEECIHAEMINLLGEKIMGIEITGDQPISLDVSQIPHGIYFLKAKFDDAEFVKKILVE